MPIIKDIEIVACIYTVRSHFGDVEPIFNIVVTSEEVMLLSFNLLTRQLDGLIEDTRCEGISFYTLLDHGTVIVLSLVEFLVQRGFDQ